MGLNLDAMIKSAKDRAGPKIRTVSSEEQEDLEQYIEQKPDRKKYPGGLRAFVEKYINGIWEGGGSGGNSV